MAGRDLRDSWCVAVVIAGLPCLVGKLKWGGGEDGAAVAWLANEGG